MIKRISPFFSLGSSRPNFTLFHPHPRKIRRGVIEMSGPGSGVHITSQSLIYFWRGAAVLVAYNRCGMYSRISQPWGQFCRHKFQTWGSDLYKIWIGDRLVICAPNTCFRLQICCFVSKLQRLKGQIQTKFHTCYPRPSVKVGQRWAKYLSQAYNQVQYRICDMSFCLETTMHQRRLG